MNWSSISPQVRFDAAPNVSTTNISSRIRPEHCRIVHRLAATPPAPARHAIPEWGKSIRQKHNNASCSSGKGFKQGKEKRHHFARYYL